ncbi:MAG: M24 family metallopeptidase [Thermomicrobiales bacterium]
MSNRLERLRASLSAHALDAALVSHPANRFYLSGYTAEDHGPEESAGVLLVAAESAVLCTSPNNVEWARSEAPAFEVVAWERPWIKTVADRLGLLGCRRVGFEDRAISFAVMRGLIEAIDGSAELVPLENAVTELRAMKDGDEIARIARAIRLTDEVFTGIAAELEVGLTEREIAWRIERAFRDRGADGAAFPTIVASGPHAARPHHGASERSIQAGEPIIIDMGARLDGYNADLTRTVWIGEPEDRLRAVYNAVYDAQAAALTMIRADISGADADKAARSVLESAGFGEHIVHSLGHGLGIQVHEAPSASPTSEQVLRAGEVLTVEPGLYFPEWGGVRIEDVVVVEGQGCRNLTTAPKARLPE